MIPYDGTPINDHLAREGRLPGDVLNPDYDFLDPRLAVFCRETLRGITAASNAVLFDVVEQLADECQAGTSGSIDSRRGVLRQRPAARAQRLRLAQSDGAVARP